MLEIVLQWVWFIGSLVFCIALSLAAFEQYHKNKTTEIISSHVLVVIYQLLACSSFLAAVMYGPFK